VGSRILDGTVAELITLKPVATQAGVSSEEPAMASISREPNGRKTIQFVDGTKRRSLRLGKLSDKAATLVRIKVEALQGARASGHPIDQETASWLGRIDRALHDRLYRMGLVASPRSDAAPVTLGEFLDGLFSRQGPQKPNTARNNLRARGLLEEFFGNTRALHSITETDADEYRYWLLNVKKLARGGIGRDLGRAKTFFKLAVRQRLIAVSPFAHISCPSQTNASRKQYVPANVVEKVIEACPSHDWRLIFALPRYAGLRVPSEIQGLKWKHIDWENNRFTVRAPKVEHHAGHETRTLPIFPELRPHLEAAREAAGSTSEYVVPRAKDGPNLRRPAEQIIKRAGVTQWEKMFVNLRASCEKDLMEIHRPDAVLGWIGHSARVALEHYAPGPTESDFQRAVQNPVHSPAIPLPHETSGIHETPEKSRVQRSGEENLIPSTGIEPVTFSSGG
jgi:integrase